MEVIIGFIFEMFKIVIQSTLYGFILLVLLNIIFKRKIKLKTWLLTSAIILVTLFIYRNTHWGDHGLGDSRRIPLQYKKEISQMNGNWSYISINKNKTIPITEFAIKDEYVVGLTGIDGIESYPPYFVWNYNTDTLSYYNSLAELDSLTTLGRLKLIPFHKHYNEYCGGWKFWLLP